ncbi:MAG: hypothetical protein ACPGXZ_05740 [Saprospiraceae bacterium]
MKVLLPIFCIFVSLNVSFGQIDKNKWINDDMIRYNSDINKLNSFHRIDICDCKKGEEIYYFYQYNYMSAANRTIDSISYPSHFIAIVKANAGRRVNAATVYFNFTKKDTIPQSGWNAFFSGVDSLDLDNMVAHYASIPCAVIRTPDATSTMLLHCKNGGWLTPHITTELEMVTSCLPSEYLRGARQVGVAWRMKQLFRSEFD